MSARGRQPDFPPFDEETFALLRDYPRVHLDLTILNSVFPADVHERELRRLVDARFGDRIMFGTDGQPAGPILRRLEAIPWLTHDQRRAILYDNAARFLRLDARTIAAHRRFRPVPGR
jgi:predicted TIM-barrel fold metal-dependent hydrolase